ncbi:class I SAM-dependent rRNA methyltransferase [Marinimicrobium sp. ABcell2]|uniref:class I SAM-dependent rRNA methyltransferase n=1 Tax=Marinimicrobium sp. ABcell2 TaxID=3069751 RepID=UPI0027B4B9C1|nr:class I SAM-dependent rRNA methyltransferase [Marinimicrobium sp. ABcell2]MDQ2076552.1 class I SAM-dependent rRNA methyltransferase [Marinimicrobium sp. ABcell2]
MTPTLKLKPGADRRLKLGHLWIYSNEVDVVASPLKSFEAGQQVRVENNKGKCLGLAFINPNGLICGRLVSRDEHLVMNKSLLVHRFKQALSLRQLFYPQPYYRLVYGDSDWLPGLVVDRFGDYLVVQIASAGMEALKEEIVTALQQVLQPKGILLSNDHGARDLEGLSSYAESVGEIPDQVELIENDTRFRVPLGEGQKTGWFYDHRDNRARLRHCVAGKRVLDVFSYLGGWGVQMASAGASSVTCVDVSGQALEWAEENARLNDVGERLSTLQGKAVDVLKELHAADERYDVVILDPPAFIKRRKDQKAGEGAYRHINELGIRLLGRDGLLLSASCSMHLGRDSLQEIVRASSRHLDRQAQILARGGQSPDHPIHPAIPETDYLKAVLARVYHS